MQTWTPYEEQSMLSVDRYRHKLLPPAVAKRRFVLSSLVPAGLSIPELIISIALLAALALAMFAQRNSEPESTGSVSDLVCIPVFVLIMYRSPISWFFGVPFERIAYWHSFAAFAATAFAVYHGVLSILNPDDEDGDRMIVVRQTIQAAFSGEDSGAYVSGCIITGAFVLLVVTSFQPIRQYFRRLWLISHHLLLIPLVVGGAMHGTTLTLLAFGIYIVDRVYHYVIETQFPQYRKTARQGKCAKLSDSLVQISFPNNSSSFTFIPGQYINVYAPKVSLFELHKFSIASIPSDTEVVLFIKPDGYWTKRLSKLSLKEATSLPCAFYSAFGSVSLDWMTDAHYRSFVLFAGGFGITPMISIYRHLLEQHSRGRPLESVKLVWVVRSAQLAHDVFKSLHSVSTQKENDDMENQTTKNIFSAAVHLSQGGGFEASTAEASEQDEIAKKVLGGSVQWLAGRPDIHSVLEHTKVLISGPEKGARIKKRVAVMGCGPSTLTNAVCKHAGRCSDSNVVYDLHLEHF